MSFLPEFDNLVDNGEEDAAVKLFYFSLTSNSQELFKELRKDKPVLRVPTRPAPLVVVTRWVDVVDVLSRHETFTVAPNRESMDDSVGPFMLARDGEEENWHHKSVMRTLLRSDDLPNIREFAGDVARRSLKGAKGEVEVVSKVGREVPLRVVQRYFGFDGPDRPSDEEMLAWSRWTQFDMFHNRDRTSELGQEVHKRNKASGLAMRDWLRKELARRSHATESSDDIFSRLLRLKKCDASIMDVEAIVTNVSGLLVGAIETTSQAIVQAVAQILKRPKIAKTAAKEAKKKDSTEFDAIVWEALRFDPIAPFVIRMTLDDAVVAPGTLDNGEEDSGTPDDAGVGSEMFRVGPGTLVAASVESAMFDEGVFEDPETFWAGRPPQHYLHLGFGHHECLGKHVGLQIIPEAVRQVLLLPGIHLIGNDDDDVGIEFKDSPFPEKFVVGLK